MNDVNNKFLTYISKTPLKCAKTLHNQNLKPDLSVEPTLIKKADTELLNAIHAKVLLSAKITEGKNTLLNSVLDKYASLLGGNNV